MLLSLPPNLTSAPLFAEVPLTPLTSASLVPEVFLPLPNLISPPSFVADEPLTLEVWAPSVFFSSPGLVDSLPLVLVAAAPPVGYLASLVAVAFASSGVPATDLLPAVNLDVAAVAVLTAPAALLREPLVGVVLLAFAPFSFSSYCALSFYCFSRRAFFLASVAATPAVGLASLDGA